MWVVATILESLFGFLVEYVDMDSEYDRREELLIVLFPIAHVEHLVPLSQKALLDRTAQRQYYQGLLFLRNKDLGLGKNTN